MKFLTVLKSVLVFLLAAALFFAPSDVYTVPSSDPVSDSVTDTPEVSSPTLADIRSAAPLDMSADDPFFDAVCYLIYNEYMSAGDGRFDPEGMLSAADAARAFEKLGYPWGGDTSKSFITRGELAEMLYSAAEKLGVSVEAQSDGADKPLLWISEQSLFDSFYGFEFLSDAALSRAQFATALIRLLNMCEDDALLKDITLSLPKRETVSLAAENHSLIQSAIDSVAEKYGAVGVQVAVIEKGTVTDRFAFGYATRDTDKMTPYHKIRAASITKVAVGAAAMLLREDGVIDLDRSIGEYWGFEVKNPHFPDDPVTVRSILTHCSSIKNVSLSTPRNYNYLKNQLQNDGFSPNKPGNIAKWSYNNHAFAVLGVTLELAANKTLDELMNERVFAPLGMDASFYPTGIKNTELLATVYDKSGKVELSVSKALTWKYHTKPGETGDPYSGGLTAGAYDIAKFFSLLANDGVYEGVRIMDAESVSLMESLSENAVRYGFYQAMPLRYMKNLYGRDGIYFHTGSSMGVYNSATYDPETGDGVVIMTTGARGDKGEAQIYKICEEINRYIYGLLN